jgi:TRAP-type C4-dicarboxylate transport system substrate-binding protein
MRRFAAVSAVLALGFFGATDADAKIKIRFSTLAPQNSSWGKVFSVWEKAVVQKTNGEIELDVFYNGVQGMEESMVGKMKTGQLDGAALTTLGLSKINKNIMAMTLPWVITSWAKLDKVRPIVAPQFEKQFEADGFKVLGWGDVGLVYGFAKGFAVKRPEDIRGHRPLVWRNEPVGPIVYSLIGQITPVPLSPTEVLPALRAGSVDMLSAPALAAEQLQWTPHLDHVTNEPVVTATGATVFRKESIDSMPADLRDVFLKMQQRVGENQNARIRKLDQEAYERMSKRMTVVTVAGDDRKAWEAVARKSLKRLAQGVFPKELMKQVADLAGFKDIDI